MQNMGKGMYTCYLVLCECKTRIPLQRYGDRAEGLDIGRACLCRQPCRLSVCLGGNLASVFKCLYLDYGAFERFVHLDALHVVEFRFHHVAVSGVYRIYSVSDGCNGGFAETAHLVCGTYGPYSVGIVGGVGRFCGEGHNLAVLAYGPAEYVVVLFPCE